MHFAIEISGIFFKKAKFLASIQMIIYVYVFLCIVYVMNGVFFI